MDDAVQDNGSDSAEDPAAGSADQPDQAADGSNSAGGGASVDPQIFTDVVDYVFTLPLDIRRATRIDLWSISKYQEICYGEGTDIPLDYLGVRVDQSLFADLDVIDEVGLNIVEYPDENITGGSLECTELEAAFPDRVAYDSLRSAWNDEVRSAYFSPAVEATKGDVATCLTQQSAIAADAEDPTGSFLNNVDNAVSADVSIYEELGPEGSFTAAYVTCTRPFFEALRSELEPRRQELVEKNRELLESYARSATDTGYIP